MLTVKADADCFSLDPQSLAQPLVGQHTHDVLTELGYSSHRIKALLDAKAVMLQTPKPSL
jgi:hypothetical protein